MAAAATHHSVSQLPGLASIATPEETGNNFEENAILKVRHYSAYTSEIVLADDSGLEVDALSGAPGVFSARYAGPEADDEDNNDFLLRMLGSAIDRTARFVCVVALAQQGAILATARGTVEGQILPAPRGHNGFGYDPLFLYPPLQRSFGELSDEQKLQVSARGQALRKAFGQLTA